MEKNPLVEIYRFPLVPKPNSIYFCVFHCFVTSEAPRAATELSLGGQKSSRRDLSIPPWSRCRIRFIFAFFKSHPGVIRGSSGDHPGIIRGSRRSRSRWGGWGGKGGDRGQRPGVKKEASYVNARRRCGVPMGSPYGGPFVKGTLFKGVTWEGYPGRLPASGLGGVPHAPK